MWTLYDWIILRLKFVFFTVVLVIVFTVILMLFSFFDHILECDILWMYLFLPCCVRKWHNRTVQSFKQHTKILNLKDFIRFDKLHQKSKGLLTCTSMTAFPSGDLLWWGTKAVVKALYLIYYNGNTKFNPEFHVRDLLIFKTKYRMLSFSKLPWHVQKYQLITFVRI